MNRFIELTVRLIYAFKRAYTRKGTFFVVFVVVFFASVMVLGSYNLLPEARSVAATAAPGLSAREPAVTPAVTPPAIAQLPATIAIPAIGLSATIANPMTTAVAVLDQALLKGAVRYPTSAKLGEEGNVVLFGHSSYLPVVRNQAYKTFNGIQKLVAGDLVTVSSLDTAYTYRVKSVTKQSANDAVIPLQVTGQVLTLATCDTFGAKTDRFVVVADFVERHSIPL